MKIYSGMSSDSKRLAELKKRNMGVMISSHPDITFLKSFVKQDLEGLYFALDNGAFSAWRKNQCFNPHAFLEAINVCRLNKLPLDFIACPDIVGGGKESYEMSEHWARYIIRGQGLALVVQEGILPAMVDRNLFDFIFIGGASLEWKMNVIPEWIEFGLPVHVGRVSSTNALKECDKMGVVSVDSTTAIRNNVWHKIDEYQNPIQTEMF